MPDGEKWTGKGSKHRIEGAEARKRYDDNMRAIYGTRVKIPPPGPERDKLIEAVVERLPGGCAVLQKMDIACVLRALEELEG